MERLNRFLTNQDKTNFIKHFETIKMYENKHLDYCEDRLMKLSGQLDACINLGFTLDHPPKLSAMPGKGFKNKVVCDVGSGNAPMASIFANMGAISHAITRGPPNKSWYHSSFDNHPNVTWETGVDYINYSKKNFKDSSIDLFLDGCSVTHFKITSEIVPNDGCYFIGKEIFRTMKDDGYLIVTSDVTLSDLDTGEFISPKSMIKCFKAAGLKLLEPDGTWPMTTSDNTPATQPYINRHQVREHEFNDYHVARFVFVKDNGVKNNV